MLVSALVLALVLVSEWALVLVSESALVLGSVLVLESAWAC